jgi:hypothetical protein
VTATATVEPLRAPWPEQHARWTPRLPLCSQGCPDLYMGAEPQRDAAALLTPEQSGPPPASLPNDGCSWIDRTYVHGTISHRPEVKNSDQVMSLQGPLS